MHRRNNLKVCVLIFCLGALICSCLYWRQSTTLVLWSWQRAEDLSFVDKNIVVAPLVATIFVDNKSVSVQPRTNVLKLPKNAQIIPVIRLDISPHIHVSDEQIDTIIQHIQSFISSCKSSTVQIDFDAAKSQRPLYKNLLEKLHAAQPNVKISVTALASWCVDDVWIDNLTITHAVPMLYNLGEHADDFKKYFKDNKQWRSKKCRGYIGFEQGDIFTKPPRGWHVYVFNNKAWSSQDYKNVKEKLK